MLRYLCFLAVVLGVRSASAPFIKPCKPSDKACLVASAQAAVPFIAPGIPELGIKSLDPMKLNTVTSNEAGLQLTFKNTIVTGMKGCTVDGVKLDLSKKKQVSTIRCDVTLKGDYKLGGRLLLLNVQGEGPYSLDIRDIVIKAYNELDTVQGEDGKPHWNITSWHHSYDVKTSTVFHFQNLFNGNKALGDTVQAIMNESWRDVMKAVAGPIVRAIVSNTVDAVAALYKAVPLEDLIAA